MKAGRLRAGAAQLELALVGACALALVGAAAAPAAVERVGKGQAAAGYWTEERMRAARPAEELLAPAAGGLAGRAAGGRDAAPSGPAALGPAAAGGSAASGLALAPGEAEPVEDAAEAPYRAHGRVFFKHNKRDYFCSGTVVRAPTRKLVATAAHCVYFKRRFASKWTFVPAYRDEEGENPAPYGRWNARRLAVPNAWWRSARDQSSSNDDMRFDVGMVSVAPRGGKPIQAAVGARRIAFNTRRARSLEAFGYPAQDPFDGKVMQRCESGWEGRDQRERPPRPIRVACGMTGGGSGGGIVNANGALISVISYSYCLEPSRPCKRAEMGKLFGPQFGQAIRRLYRSEAKRKRKARARGAKSARRG